MKITPSVKIVKLDTYILSNSHKQRGRGYFLCPRGQGVGSAPNVHEGPRGGQNRTKIGLRSF